MILASEFDLDVLLQRIADLACEVVGARYAAVGVLGESGDLDKFVYSGIDQATADQIGDLPRGRGVLGVLIEEGKPLRLRHISEHARSYGFPEHHPPMESFLGVPIVVRGRVFGRLYLTEKGNSAEFTKDDERIALTLASQAGVAVENARLYLEVEARRDELARRMSDLAVLEERDRISKELHDGVIQSIYSVGLSLQGTMAFLERDPSLAKRRIDEVIAELDNTVRDVRGYIFELRPKSVEEHGIEGAIEGLVRDFEVNTLAEITLDLHSDAFDFLEEADQSHVVQIVREVLSNIARHSHASQLSVICATQGHEVVLTIEDDGRTYDPDKVKRGQGLSNLSGRARKVKGNLSIEPRGTKGMRHQLRIPIGETP